MNLLNFLAQNWDSILIVLAFAALMAVLVWRGEKGIVAKIIFFVVTAIEREFGSGTGKLKLAAAIEAVYPKLPAIVRMFVTAATIERWIEEGLAKAKEEWAKNPALLDYAAPTEH